ncbi:hypothetical protein BDA99DRAFT_555352 [Phascolomyces articulosus]|uniref:Uncharacterized protein n=1 Tax=Phascolomyces articulosus TaxID=60185 RepID=A0AAD5KMF9_9FUNG|nr:hypothetical protein BDA99DRAFT_555352 [Phascolomyces articulosus]
MANVDTCLVSLKSIHKQLSVFITSLLRFVVDAKPFPLTQGSESPLIHIDIALVSSSDNYYYAKTRYGSVIEHDNMKRTNTTSDEVATRINFTIVHKIAAAKMVYVGKSSYEPLVELTTSKFPSEAPPSSEDSERFETSLKYLTGHFINLDVMTPIIDDTIAMIREDVDCDMSYSNVCKETPIDSLYLVPQFNITFDIAVNGPTGSISLSGVKEFVANQSQVTAEFFKTRYQ